MIKNIGIMSMRYILRRPKPEDLGDVRTKLPSLDEELGKADADFMRTLTHRVNSLRAVHYTFSTRKVDTHWEWVCPSVEFDCEDREGIFVLCDAYHVPRPQHLISS